jgi:hypothetical protein
LLYCAKSGNLLRGKWLRVRKHRNVDMVTVSTNGPDLGIAGLEACTTCSGSPRRIRPVADWKPKLHSVVRDPRYPRLNLFRREGGDDFLEARVIAQWIPKRQQFQLAVGDGSWWTDSHGELLAGEIFLAGPGSDHR